jgi:hypothetical protein
MLFERSVVEQCSNGLPRELADRPPRTLQPLLGAEQIVGHSENGLLFWAQFGYRSSKSVSRHVANRLCCPDLANRLKYSKHGPDTDAHLACDSLNQ